jgi:hypothetical protein
MIVGRRYEGQRVVVGGERFERCAFARCEVVLDGRPVHLVDSSFEGCTWSLEGPAAATVDLLAALCRGDPALRLALARRLGLSVPAAEEAGRRRRPAAARGRR